MYRENIFMVSGHLSSSCDTIIYKGSVGLWGSATTGHYLALVFISSNLAKCNAV